MRKMFVAKSDFDQYKKDNEIKCDLKRSSCGSMGEDIREIKQDIKELFRELRDNIKAANGKANGN